MNAKKMIAYAGVDVDDTAYHVAVLLGDTGEFLEFRCKPDHGVLVKKLHSVISVKYTIHVCYEACYLGYSLYRFLQSRDIHCDVIAPSLIPQEPGKRKKTDRLDSRKLCRYYAMNMLTSVCVPEFENEQVRDLVRSREFLVRQRKMLKCHINSACKRYELDYRKATGHKAKWTDRHLGWLRKEVASMEDKAVCRSNFEILLSEYSSLTENIEKLEETVVAQAEQDGYKKVKDALVCFRGIDTLTAMTLATELGDVRRFGHPKQVMSYVGLDVAEHSSGGKERKKGLTKTGNKHIRRILIEACQSATRSHYVSKRLKMARAKQPQTVVAIADRCMKRLHKKSTRMLYAGKHNNKIKAACAREMLGFVWEAMYAAS